MFAGICARQWFLSRRTLAATVVVVEMLLPAAGMADDKSVPVWQLTPGQRFSVETTTHRITDIHIGAHHSVTDVTDHVTLQYTMPAVNRRGIAQFRVQIQSLDRSIISENGVTTVHSLVPNRAFKVPTVAVLVADRGNQIKVLGRSSLFRTELPEAHRILAEICGDEVLRAWFDMPFRIPVHTAPVPVPSPARPSSSDDADAPSNDTPGDELHLQTGAEWNRTQDISLGLPGAVRCNCTYSVDVIDDMAARLSVTGTFRVQLREPDEESPLNFENFQMTKNDMSGDGKILMDELTGLPQSIELSHQLTLEGRAAVISGGRSYDVRFKQSLTQTSIASEFEIQDLQQGVPLSISP